MAWLDIFFSNYLIFIVVLVVPYLWFKNYRLLAFKTSLAALFAWFAVSFIKDFYYVPRPYLLSHHPSVLGIWLDGSFPSGHTALCISISLMVYSRFRKLGLILFFSSFLIAVSRIIGGIHTLYDVLGGVVIGLTSAFITQKINFSHLKKAFRG